MPTGRNLYARLHWASASVQRGNAILVMGLRGTSWRSAQGGLTGHRPTPSHAHLFQPDGRDARRPTASSMRWDGTLRRERPQARAHASNARGWVRRTASQPHRQRASAAPRTCATPSRKRRRRATSRSRGCARVLPAPSWPDRAQGGAWSRRAA